MKIKDATDRKFTCDGAIDHNSDVRMTHMALFFEILYLKSPWHNACSRGEYTYALFLRNDFCRC